MLPFRHFRHISPSFRFCRTLLSASKVNEDFNIDVSSIEVRICKTHDELDECVRLQQQIWQFNDLDTIPRRAFIATSSVGGVVLGAYGSNGTKLKLLGILWAIPGIFHGINPQPYMHVETVAVHPRTRNYRISQRMMLAISQYTLSQNMDIMTGQFDPTDSKLAHLYINRCCAISNRYTTHYYGASSSPLQKLPTDRLHLKWRLNLLNLKREDKLFPPKEFLISDSDCSEEVHVPAQMAEWKRVGDIRAVKAQQDIRDKLTTAFERGLVILKFRFEQDGTGVYQLGHFTNIK